MVNIAMFIKISDNLQSMKIAMGIDANGGEWSDGEPPTRKIVKALSLFQKDNPNISFVLYGDERLIRRHLKFDDGDRASRYNDVYSFDSSRTSIVNCLFGGKEREKSEHAIKDDWLKDNIEFTNARANTSTVKLMEDLSAGETIDCACSAGNTEDLISSATINSKLIDGYGAKRPLLPALIPADNRRFILADVGAVTDITPEQGLAFAIAVNEYAKLVLGWENPRVKILSIGEEKWKGNEFTKGLRDIIVEYNCNNTNELNFDPDKPYVEGDTVLLEDKADIVITDGFSGNVFIKVMKGTLKMTGGKLKNVLFNPKSVLDGPLMLSTALYAALTYFPFRISSHYRGFKNFNPDKHNGAPLLGLNDYAVKMHGSSTVRGFYTGFGVTRDYHNSNAIETIRQVLSTK